ncbi:MAG: hypothetical protein AAF772_20105, partial [Acidobacteriota bacterium]
MTPLAFRTEPTTSFQPLVDSRSAGSTPLSISPTGLTASGDAFEQSRPTLFGAPTAQLSMAAERAAGVWDLSQQLASADSQLSIAIGTAEGNRRPDGSKTSIYYGHTDPGNGLRNIGNFSVNEISGQRFTDPAQADNY